MKKILCVLVLVMIWLGSFAQRQPILDYGAYEPSEMKIFAKGLERKSQKFHELVVKLVNKKLSEAGKKERISNSDNDIDMVFDNTTIDEVDLSIGSFKNSFWDVKLQEVIFGKLSLVQYKDLAGITKIYGVTFILYKYRCGNLLDAPVVKIDEEVKENKSELEKEVFSLIVKKEENSPPIDYGGKKLIAEAVASEQQSVDLNLPKPHKKFLKRKGVKIAGIVILAGGVEELIRNFLVPLIFPKKAVVIQQQQQEEEFNPVDANPQN